MKISVENLYVDIGAYRVKEVSMFQWCGLGESCLFSIYNNQQLLNEAEGGGWITLSKICRIFHILRQPNSVIALLFIQNNSNFKNKLKMLTSVDVKFTSIVHLFREIQQIKVCSGLQIYSKEQMLSVELTSRCSCYVFRQYFAVKRVQCPPDSSAILLKQPKQLNLIPRFPWSTVQYDSSAAGYGELCVWFYPIRNPEIF